MNNEIINSNMTVINWNFDSLNIIRAKQQLRRFLEEQSEMKGYSIKIDNYHTKRISELTAIINN